MMAASNTQLSTTAQPERITPTAEILSRACMCKSTLIRLENAGLFPRRQLIGKRKKGLLESVFAAWLASRAPTDTAQ